MTTTSTLLAGANNAVAPDEASTEAQIILTYLAVGLLHQNREIERGAAIPATLLDRYLQLGWDKLAQLCYRHSTPPPLHLPDLVSWLHEPPAMWPGIGFLFQTEESGEALLSFGAPSQACLELGRDIHLATDLDRELGDIPFKSILEYCREQRKPDQYTLARRFLCEHPYLGDGTVTISHRLDLDRPIREWLSQAYEPVPQVCIRQVNGQPSIALCPRCGWPLQWRTERANCYSELCTHIVGQLSDRARWRPYVREACQTKRAEQNSIVGPEQPLLALYHQLVDEFHLDCELWPHIDACDLLVRFPNGPVWALDLKDYQSPRKLALALDPFTTAIDWDQAFYIFPDHRNRGRYLHTFRQFWARERHVEALFVSGFLSRVEEELADA